MNLSEIILSITAIVVAWQAWETRCLVKLTKIKDQPLLVVEFPDNGARVQFKNIGQSPAYSLSISSIKITTNEYLNFDPLYTSRLPILPNESHEVWMHHKETSKGSVKSVADSISVLKNFITNKNTHVKIMLQYFDKDGEKIERSLYIRINGHNQIYATTTDE